MIQKLPICNILLKTNNYSGCGCTDISCDCADSCKINCDEEPTYTRKKKIKIEEKDDKGNIINIKEQETDEDETVPFILTIDYGKGVTPYLTKALQEIIILNKNQQIKIDNLENKVATLETQNNDLQNRIATLENLVNQLLSK